MIIKLFIIQTFSSFFFPPSHYSNAVYETILPSPPPPPSPPHHHLSLIPSKQILFADFTCVCPFSGHPDFIAFIKQSIVIISPQLWFGWFFSRAVRDNNVWGGEEKKKSSRRVSNLLNKGYTVRWNSQKCCICVFLSQTSFFPSSRVSFWHIMTISKCFSGKFLPSVRL